MQDIQTKNVVFEVSLPVQLLEQLHDLQLKYYGEMYTPDFSVHILNATLTEIHRLNKNIKKRGL